jgi:hypothetical protein
LFAEHTVVTVTLDSTLIQNGELPAADLDGGAVVLSIPAGAYFAFNEVASEIWNMLAQPCRVDQIFGSLAKLHDVDAETLTRDVAPFLQTLIEHRLIRVVDPG